MKHLTILIAAVLASIAVPAYSATFYVAKTGSDASTCTSSASPCLTIGHAQTLATAAGDVVQVAAGTYAESITLSHSGSSAGPITFRGQDGSGCPTAAIVDVNSPTGSHPASSVIISGGFDIAASYVTVDCFHIKTTGNGGFDIAAGTSNDKITNNEIDGNGSATPGGGIYFEGIGSVKAASYAKSFTITANYIHGVSGGIFLVCSACTVSENEITALAGDEPGSDHDYLDAWGVGTVIRHNYMHGNTCNSCVGYDCHMDCIQAWNTTGDGTEVSQNMTFDRNICFNHHEGVIVQDNSSNGDVANWTVTNNVFAYGPFDDGSGHLCQAGPVHPWCWVFEDGALGAANSFLNNSCIDGAEGFRNTKGSASFKDNLYYSAGNNTSVYDTAGATTTGANNLYFALSGIFDGGSFSGDLINKNPMFVTVGTGGTSGKCTGCNYSLQSTSAARDAGVSTAPTVTTDLLGHARPQGSAYDIGAYEFGATAPAVPAAPTNLSVVVH